MRCKGTTLDLLALDMYFFSTFLPLNVNEEPISDTEQAGWQGKFNYFLNSLLFIYQRCIVYRSL